MFKGTPHSSANSSPSTTSMVLPFHSSGKRRSSDATAARDEGSLSAMVRASRIASARPKLLLNLSIAINVLVIALIFFGSNPLAGGTLHLPRPEDGLTFFAGQKEMEVPVATRSCDMCSMDPELCQELGPASVARAVAYSGSNDRIHRLFAKLRSGQRLTMGVVGGSVSKGHSLWEPSNDLENASTNLNRIIFDYLNNLYPAPNGVITKESGREDDKNSFINGAQGGTGTSYFSLCFGEHLPEDLDFVTIELAINDEVLLYNQDNYELMIRGLLDLPRQPAILNINVFALMFMQIMNGGDLHNGIAQYYDLPIVSLRNAILPNVLNNLTYTQEVFHTHGNFTDELTNTDLRHINTKGHGLTGRLAVAYLESQKCEMEKKETMLGLNPENIDIDQMYPSPPLPRLRLVGGYDTNSTIPKISPNCFSTNSKLHTLKPAKTDGWREWNWENKNYIIADKVGSTVSFPFTTSLGSVQLHYLRSAEFGLGSVYCWVDDERDKAKKLDGYWNLKYNIGRQETIRDKLAPGDHMLNCELINATADPKGGHEFRIISVTSI